MKEVGKSGTVGILHEIIDYVEFDGTWHLYDGITGYSDYFGDDATTHRFGLRDRKSGRPANSRNRFFPYSEGRELKSVVTLKWYGGPLGHVRPIHIEHITVCRFRSGG